MGRFHDPANPLWGRVEMPEHTILTKRSMPSSTVDIETLQAQNGLRRVAGEQTLALGLTVAPDQFEQALAKLRSDTEQGLEALRLGQPAEKRAKK